MFGYFCIKFIDSMLKCKRLLVYTNSFFPDEYEKNDKIIPKFSITKKIMMNKLYFAICGKYRKF